MGPFSPHRQALRYSTAVLCSLFFFTCFEGYMPHQICNILKTVNNIASNIIKNWKQLVSKVGFLLLQTTNEAETYLSGFSTFISKQQPSHHRSDTECFCLSRNVSCCQSSLRVWQLLVFRKSTEWYIDFSKIWSRET